MKQILIVELVENCKLVKEGSQENGHDCWGKLEFTSYKYVWIGDKKQNCWDGMFVVHDGETVKSVHFDWDKPKVEYQENEIDFAYGWTLSTEKDYNNPKAGFEYRMILKFTPAPPSSPTATEEEFFLKHFMNKDFSTIGIDKPVVFTTSVIKFISEVMTEYASLKEQEAHVKALQSVIDALNVVIQDEETDEEIAAGMDCAVKVIERLKK